MSLNDQLEQMRQASWGKWPSQNRAIVERARDELAHSGLLEQGLKVGDAAPNFSLQTPTDERIVLYDLLRSSPVVLTFFRGHW